MVFLLAGGIGENEVIVLAVDYAGNGIGVLWRDFVSMGFSDSGVASYVK